MDPETFRLTQFMIQKTTGLDQRQTAACIETSVETDRNFITLGQENAKDKIFSIYLM